MAAGSGWGLSLLGLGTVHAQVGPEPRVWQTVWEWEGEGRAGGPDIGTWQDWLEGGVVLKSPERWLGVPFRHGLAQWTARLKRREENGMPPPTGTASVFDATGMMRSEALLQSRMVRKGFLNGAVSMDTVHLREDHVALHIRLDPGVRMKCRSVSLDADSSGLDQESAQWFKDAWSRWEGRPLDLDELDRDRDRWARNLQEQGWFGLTSEFVAIAIDTTGSDTTAMVDLNIRVLPALREPGGRGHRKAKLDSISFQWHPQRLTVMTDTFAMGIHWRLPFGRDLRGMGHRIDLAEGDMFSPGKLAAARQSLRVIPLVEDVRVDISTKEVAEDRAFLPLHVHFDTYPAERRVMRVNGALTSRQGLGGEVAFSLSDQDFRKRAEQVSLDFGAGLETVTPYDVGQDAALQEPTLFNSRILTLGLTYDAARLIPFGPDRFPRSNKPESLIALTVRDESRPRFNRTYVQLGLVERFVENSTKGSRIELRPLEVALTASNLDAGFRADLDSLGSDVLTSSFESRALFGSGISWRLSPGRKGNSPWVWDMRMELEGAGNAFHLLDPRSPEETTVPLPSLFGETANVQVARYTRILMEARAGWSPDGRSGIFTRLFAGLAASSIDGVAVPIEKQFYVGGPNSMRGWQALGLGPGGSDVAGLRVRGDIRLETNIEYRRYVNDWVQCALFFDAGNIWMTRPEDARPNVHFQTSTFMSQLGLSGGMGIRLDFGYFLVRCDAGVPLKWPDGAIPTGSRWRIHPAVALPF